MQRITAVRAQSAYEEEDGTVFGKPSANYAKDREVKWIVNENITKSFDLDDFWVKKVKSESNSEYSALNNVIFSDREGVTRRSL